MKNKECRRCKKVKPITEFGPQARTYDGHRNYCRDCMCDISREWYSAHRAYAKERARKYYHEVVKPKREQNHG